MTTAGVAGPAPVVEPTADQRWRGALGRALVILGVIGLAVVGLVLVANLTSYYTFVRGLAWSPDGTRIAYGHDGGGTWVVAADGSSGPLQLTGSDSPVGSSPAWSPDGTRIAYTGSGPRATEIWVVGADGSSAPVKLAADGSAPAWSPDGTRIAYTGPGPRVTEIWVVSADGSSAPVKLAADGGNPRQLVQLLSTQAQEVPAWSPDGTQIVFVGVPGEGAQSIWVVDADGENLRQVTPDGFKPAWSPDGRQIAYVIPPSKGPSGTLWVVNVDGTGGTPLPCDVQGGGWDYQGIPQWTSDGRVAVDCRDGMVLMNPDGTDRQVVLAADEGKPLAVEGARVLSPDGTRVTYATGAGRRTDIVVHTIDGSTQITLIH